MNEMSFYYRNISGTKNVIKRKKKVKQGEEDIRQMLTVKINNLGSPNKPIDSNLSTCM